MTVSLPVHQWYEAIGVRRSRRHYDGRPVEPSLIKKLRVLCAEFTPFPGTRAVIIDRSPEKVFKGAVGHYGEVKGAPAYAAFVGDMREPYVQERVGYLGEAIILEATHLGLATCWVGGFFRPDVAGTEIGVAEYEQVLAVTPLGYSVREYTFEERLLSGFGRSHKRRPLTELTTGLEPNRRPDWINSALVVARLAPSAVNRQPWRFEVGEDQITISVDNDRDSYGISKRLDCGIAMLHLEIGAAQSGVFGRWGFLEAPQVARFSLQGN